MADDWVQRFLDDRIRKGIKTERNSTLDEYKSAFSTIRNKFHLELDKAGLQEINSALVEMRMRYKPEYYFHLVALIKATLKVLKRNKIDEQIAYPKLPDRKTHVQKMVIPDEEIRTLIEKAPSLLDRLIVELLDELGGRRGEITSLKIKSVQFDEYGAILTLTGKTGTRRRRVYSAVRDLRDYINNHPGKDDPNSPLLLTPVWRTPFSRAYFTNYVGSLGKQILGRRIRPHMFRHTKATRDAKFFTDRELMALNGWTDPDTISVYVDLSMRDVEDKDLVVHGLKTKEEILRPISKPRNCLKCGEENAPVAIYCVKCGEVLTAQDLDRLMADRGFVEQFVNHPTFQDALKKAVGVTR